MPHVDDVEGGSDDVVTDVSDIDITMPSDGGSDDGGGPDTDAGEPSSPPGGSTDPTTGGANPDAGTPTSPPGGSTGGGGGGSTGPDPDAGEPTSPPGGSTSPPDTEPEPDRDPQFPETPTRDDRDGGGRPPAGGGGGGGGATPPTQPEPTPDRTSGQPRPSADGLTQSEREQAAERLEEQESELSLVERGILSEEDIGVRPRDIERTPAGGFRGRFTLTESGRRRLAERAARRSPAVAAVDPDDIRVSGSSVIVPAEADVGTTGEFVFDFDAGTAETRGFQQPSEPTIDTSGVPTDQAGPAADAEREIRTGGAGAIAAGLAAQEARQQGVAVGAGEVELGQRTRIRVIGGDEEPTPQPRDPAAVMEPAAGSAADLGVVGQPDRRLFPEGTETETVGAAGPLGITVPRDREPQVGEVQVDVEGALRDAAPDLLLERRGGDRPSEVIAVPEGAPGAGVPAGRDIERFPLRDVAEGVSRDVEQPGPGVPSGVELERRAARSGLEAAFATGPGPEAPAQTDVETVGAAGPLGVTVPRDREPAVSAEDIARVVGRDATEPGVGVPAGRDIESADVTRALDAIAATGPGPDAPTRTDVETIGAAGPLGVTVPRDREPAITAEDVADVIVTEPEAIGVGVPRQQAATPREVEAARQRIGEGVTGAGLAVSTPFVRAMQQRQQRDTVNVERALRDQAADLIVTEQEIEAGEFQETPEEFGDFDLTIGDVDVKTSLRVQSEAFRKQTGALAEGVTDPFFEEGSFEDVTAETFVRQGSELFNVPGVTLEGIQAVELGTELATSPRETGPRAAAAGIEAGEQLATRFRQNPAMAAGTGLALAAQLPASLAFLRGVGRVSPTLARYQDIAWNTPERVAKSLTGVRQQAPLAEVRAFGQRIRGAEVDVGTRMGAGLGGLEFEVELGDADAGRTGTTPGEIQLADVVATSELDEPRAPFGLRGGRPRVSRKPERAGVTETGTFVGSFTRQSDPAFGGTGKPATTGRDFSDAMEALQSVNRRQQAEAPTLSLGEAGAAGALARTEQVTEPTVGLETEPIGDFKQDFGLVSAERTRVSEAEASLLTLGAQQDELATQFEAGEVVSGERERQEQAQAAFAVGDLELDLEEETLGLAQAAQEPEVGVETDVGIRAEAEQDFGVAQDVEQELGVDLEQELEQEQELEVELELEQEQELEIEQEFEPEFEPELEAELEFEFEPELESELAGIMPDRPRGQPFERGGGVFAERQVVFEGITGEEFVFGEGGIAGAAERVEADQQQEDVEIDVGDLGMDFDRDRRRDDDDLFGGIL